MRKFLTQEISENLIHAFVKSRLDYHNSLLYGLRNCLISKMQRVQNAAARLVFRTPRCCDITPLLTELHWLNIKHRINFKVIPVTYRSIYGTAAEYIKNLVSLKQNSKYGLWSNNTILLTPLAIRTLPTHGDRAFAVAIPRLWNSLPVEIREEQSLNTSK